ncbi:hypothetical protein HZA97_08365 [Candidatus Woesearchaeota archaeon]|nr:hypothetical protein [Candidatus Woesearchaeota archaeon]
MEVTKMGEKYYVLHKFDQIGNSLQANRYKRALYDRIKGFSSVDAAAEFARSVLNEKPILIKEAITFEDANRIKNPSNPYVIATYFGNKYRHECYDGSSDPVPTHEVERTTLNQLESRLESIAEEGPDKIYWGIELKLFSIDRKS